MIGVMDAVLLDHWCGLVVCHQVNGVLYACSSPLVESENIDSHYSWLYMCSITNIFNTQDTLHQLRERR